MTSSATAPRDRYPDALRAGALLVVVFGHWLATLPRLVDGRMVDTDHLLLVWDAAGALTWALQVVPLFVFVSAAVSTDGAERRLAAGEPQVHWWGGRALGLARPTLTYLGVLAVLALIAQVTGGRLLGPLNNSLTIHLWFLLMLLAVQALLPVCLRADRRWGLGAVVGLVLVAALADVLRAGITRPGQLLELGELVTSTTGGVAWVNYLSVWLIPQQLGIAWYRGRFQGARAGLALVTLGGAWLAASVASGYPVAMVGGDLAGASNVLPPTLALIGVMWLQIGAVLLVEHPARRALQHRPLGRVVAILGALGMPLYLWHKLAELPAAWLGERLGAPIDAGVPGEAGFWLGRAWWLALCLVAVAPVMAAVIAFETRRRRRVPTTERAGLLLSGGAAVIVGLVVAIGLGAWPGSLIGATAVAAGSAALRQRSQRRTPARRGAP